MENIFKNAYFGKPYKTRDGRKAIYCKYEMIYGVVPNSEHSITTHLLLINNMQFVNVFEDGSTAIGKEYPNDIVSEWQDVIDDNNLNEIAYEELGVSKEDMEEFDACLWTSDEYIDAFKAGYRKALMK